MKFVLIFCVLILCIGAGCNTADEVPPKTADTSTTKTVVEKPADVDTLDIAMNACENSGYTSVLTYNKESKTTDIYCEFSDGYACDTISFLQGNCTTTSTNRIYLASEDGILSNIRTCPEDEIPVCADTGVTYVNSCIAALQNAVITHTGVCADDEISLAAGNDTPDTLSPTQGGNTETNTTESATLQSGTPIWISYLSGITGGQINGPGAPVKKECTYGTTRVFYLVENCPNCFSTLYNNEGQVLCHPHNDIKNECPSYFNKDNNEANCTKQ